MAKLIGGGNLTELYALSSVWAVGSKVIDLNTNFTTQIAGHEKSKNLEATVTHEKFDSTITDLFSKYLSEEGEVTTEMYEDGTPNATITTITGSTDISNVLLAFTYSGASKEGSPKRYVKVFPCVLQGGGYTMEAEKSIRPETKLIAVAAATGIGLATSLYNSTKVSGMVLATIPSGAYGLSTWLTAVSY